MNLYEINQGIINCLDAETGEIFDVEAFEKLCMAKNEKLENIACWIKNLKAESEALKAEKQAFADRQAHTERLIKNLQNRLQEELNGEKFSSSKVLISFRKSETVEVDDIWSISEFDEDLVSYSEPKPDKKKIKEKLKAGIEIPGCSLVENKNIQIK